MLDNLKQLNELRKLRSQALKMQRELAQEEVELEEGGIRVVASGDQKIRLVEIDGESQERLVRVLNKALEKAQRQAALKMAQSGGGLMGLLGK
ncbi:MAG: YbaB/EbfC family nucleoid-associated protein [Candidatus Pacebacteria bacterium]|nr:YbaB/EbfC family nucleoid-associated protein [Candidatus Paceibacterota bacterium]